MFPRLLGTGHITISKCTPVDRTTGTSGGAVHWAVLTSKNPRNCSPSVPLIAFYDDVEMELPLQFRPGRRMMLTKHWVVKNLHTCCSIGIRDDGCNIFSAHLWCPRVGPHIYLPPVLFGCPAVIVHTVVQRALIFWLCWRFRWWPWRAGAGRRSLFVCQFSIISHARCSVLQFGTFLLMRQEFHKLQLLIMLRRWVTALCERRKLFTN